MPKSFEYLIWRGLPAALNVIAILLLSRLYGATEFGLYNLFFSTVVFVKTAGLNWITLSAQRFYYEDEAGTIPASAALSLVALPLAFALFVIISPADLRAGPILLIAACVLLLEGWFELALVHQRLLFQPRLYGILLLGRATLFLGLGAAFWWLGSGGWGLFAALAVALVIPVLASARRSLVVLSLEGARRKLRGFFGFGLPAALAMAFSMQFMLVVKYALLAGDGLGGVGAFAVTSDVIQNGFFVLMLTVTLGLHPRTTKAWSAGDGDLVRRNLMRLVLALSAICLVLIGMILAFRPVAHWVLEGVFLEVFSEGALPLSLLFSLAIFKVGVLDFILGLRRQVVTQIILSALMLGAIYLTAVARFSAGLAPMVYALCAVMALTVIIQAVIIALRRPAEAPL